MNILNIGIVASVDSGKTTLTEKIIEKTTKGYDAGKIEDGNTTTDYHSFEKRRGITVFSEGVDFNYKDVHFNLIDTPGHIDFFEETKKSLLAVDAVILIVSAVDGITDRVRNIWKMLEQENKPLLVFINKCDIPHSNGDSVIEDMKKMSSKILELTDIDSLVDNIGEYEEDLMEAYLEDNIENHHLNEAIRRHILYGNIIPILKGAANLGDGVNELLDLLVTYFPKYIKDDEGMNWGLVYKVRWDKKDGMLTYIKMLSGKIATRDEIETKEGINKIVEIRRYRGEKYEVLDELTSGDIGVVRGLENISVGDYIGILAPSAYEYSPIYFTTDFISDDVAKLLEALDTLNKEEGFLNPKVDRELGHVEISTYGSVHLEIIKEILLERFGVESDYLPPIPKYKEAITETTKGFCHYEPKKHYARVEVEISPYFENTFESKVRLDDLPHRYQSIIEKTIPEALSSGVLLGREMHGVKVTLIGAKAHEEHTHGGDFRIATIRSIRQALEKNKSILLEPSLKFVINSNIDEEDKVKSSLNKAGIDFIYEEDKNIKGDTSIITLTGDIPVSKKVTLDKMIREALRATRVNYEDKGHVECKNANKVIETYKKRYKIDEKLFNSVSLFRAKKKMKKVRGYETDL